MPIRIVQLLILLGAPLSAANAQPPPITFHSVYVSAESRSARIKEFQYYVLVAEADVGEARAGYFPQISLSGSSEVKQYGPNAYNGSVPSPAYALATSSWNLFDGGKTTHTVVSREHGKGAAAARLDGVRAELAREVAELSLDRRRLDQQRRVYTAMHHKVNNIAQAIREQISVDQGRRSELHTLNTKLLQLAIQESEMTRRELEWQARSEKLIGTPRIDGEVFIPALESYVWAGHLQAISRGEPAALEALKQEAESARAAVKAASGQNFPSINWVVQKSTQKDILDRDTPAYTAITFSLDLFKGFGISNAQRSAAARSAAMSSRYDHALREFDNQIKGWLAQIASTQKQVDRLEAIEQDALKLKETAYRRHEYARLTHTELLDAEITYFAAQLAHMNSRFDHLQLRARVLTESGFYRKLFE